MHADIEISGIIYNIYFYRQTQSKMLQGTERSECRNPKGGIDERLPLPRTEGEGSWDRMGLLLIREGMR